jgi:hypothetical protein
VRFLRAVYQLREAGLAQLVQLGQTLSSWLEEIVAIWRFSRDNGITEGVHNKMELINRQAYGFRNFQSWRRSVESAKPLKDGAGDGGRTRDVQLGKLPFLCKYNTYASKALVLGHLTR